MDWVNIVSNPGKVVHLNEVEGRGDEGAFNFGVFRVVGHQSDFALKFGDSQFFENKNELDVYREIHIRLSQTSFAPKLFDFMIESQFLMKLIDVLNAKTNSKIQDNRIISDGYCVMMQYVSGVWNFKKSKIIDLNKIIRISAEHLYGILTQFDDIEKTLNDLNIFADDTQFFIDTDLKVWLGDIEGCVPAKGRQNDFTSDKEMFVRIWEKYHKPDTSI